MEFTDGLVGHIDKHEEDLLRDWPPSSLPYKGGEALFLRRPTNLFLTSSRPYFQQTLYSIQTD